MTNRYMLLIEYDGTRYKGWQRLGNTDQTIQQKIETLLSRILEENIEIHGSGRTDNGVHAYGQVAHFDTSQVIEEDKFIAICNEMLPQDIVFKQITKVDSQFHARLSAKSKKYVYKIWNSPIPSALYRKYIYHVNKPLDLTAIERAISYLVGEYDFSSFTANKSKKKSMLRRINGIEIKQDGEVLEFIFDGEGFLHKMVRIITGTLVEVGLGEKTPEDVANILKQQDRKLAGHTAPSHGLYLLEVKY